ncbi:MAG: long-chain fatty acid--CoA ligase [Bacteroidetes bacterium]|nr:MAG: long-chain fatty acid--CoA ligase [Bacteroidota bacterium]REK06614.1 MAG: long-chain fatty acid--CoA ligase [Bacteroidota bacterium]REK33380.1 MAG: long-chain fatty acid--CoA ligase [Bacteroidota bacterium]REK49779.1 MAG: long-chain fatty acid--CoA ligase [Bacteroidota bacterium]
MIKRLFDIPDYQNSNFPKQDSLCGKLNGNWKCHSTSEFISLSQKLSAGLMSLGLRKDDKATIISANRPEWNIADMGMMQIGVVNVPVYTTLSEKDLIFILNDCQAKILFAGDKLLYEKISKIKSDIPSLTDIFTFDQIAGAQHWTDLLKDFSGDEQKRFESIRDSILPGDLATILYTSGTTGQPKGVMLSHNNIVSNVLASKDLCPVDERHKALSFLPLCHSYERMLTYLYMYRGVSIYYAESMEKIADNLKEIKPEVFSTVPRLLEKVYDKIVEKGKDLTGLKKILFFWALNLGLRYELNKRNGFWYEFQLGLANKIIFSKWREALGSKVKVIVSGGAALQPRLARVFWAAKIHVLEGYGLTETSPVVCVNNLEPNGTKFGTVGPPISGVEVKIAEDGEILCKGPNIMLGYYKRPDLTEQVIKDGWFHTGDIGIIEENRFLKITDRKKEIFKTSGGKFIAPQALENKFKESIFIEQIMVIGENQKFPAALVVPSFAQLKRWCEESGLDTSSNETMISHSEVVSLFRKEIEKLNESFGRTEQVKKIRLLPREWTIDSGELTATLKLKRKVIAENNSALISSIYDQS